MADKNITIGRVINVTGVIGVLLGVLLFTFGIVLLYFGTASALTFQARFTGFGSRHHRPHPEEAH